MSDKNILKENSLYIKDSWEKPLLSLTQSWALHLFLETVPRDCTEESLAGMCHMRASPSVRETHQQFTHDIRNHWTSVSTLLGLISRVYRNLHNWRSNSIHNIIPLLKKEMYIDWLGLVAFYGISTLEGYSIPNPLHTFILNIYL